MCLTLRVFLEYFLGLLDEVVCGFANSDAGALQRPHGAGLRVRLDLAGNHQLGSGGGNLLGRGYQSLARLQTLDQSVGCVAQLLGRFRHNLGSRNQA